MLCVLSPRLFCVRGVGAEHVTDLFQDQMQLRFRYFSAGSSARRCVNPAVRVRVGVRVGVRVRTWKQHVFCDLIRNSEVRLQRVLSWKKCPVHFVTLFIVHLLVSVHTNSEKKS